MMRPGCSAPTVCQLAYGAFVCVGAPQADHNSLEGRIEPHTCEHTYIHAHTHAHTHTHAQGQSCRQNSGVCRGLLLNRLLIERLVFWVPVCVCVCVVVEYKEPGTLSVLGSLYVTHARTHAHTSRLDVHQAAYLTPTPCTVPTAAHPHALFLCAEFSCLNTDASLRAALLDGLSSSCWGRRVVDGLIGCIGFTLCRLLLLVLSVSVRQQGRAAKRGNLQAKPCRQGKQEENKSPFAPWFLRLPVAGLCMADFFGLVAPVVSSWGFHCSAISVHLDASLNFPPAHIIVIWRYLSVSYPEGKTTVRLLVLCAP